MNKVKAILLGLFVGFVASYINVVTSGFVAAYMPMNFVEMTEGMSQKYTNLIIQAFLIFVGFLAALPMAIAGYIFMLTFKLNADKLFLIISVGVLLGCHLYISYKTPLTIFSIISTAVPCILLWFALSAPNKQLKNGRLTAAL